MTSMLYPYMYADTTDITMIEGNSSNATTTNSGEELTITDNATEATTTPWITTTIQQTITSLGGTTMVAAPTTEIDTATTNAAMPSHTPLCVNCIFVCIYSFIISAYFPYQ